MLWRSLVLAVVSVLLLIGQAKLALSQITDLENKKASVDKIFKDF